MQDDLIAKSLREEITKFRIYLTDFERTFSGLVLEEIVGDISLAGSDLEDAMDFFSLGRRKCFFYRRLSEIIKRSDLFGLFQKIRKTNRIVSICVMMWGHRVVIIQMDCLSFLGRGDRHLLL